MVLAKRYEIVKMCIASLESALPQVLAKPEYFKRWCCTMVKAEQSLAALRDELGKNGIVCTN